MNSFGRFLCCSCIIATVLPLATAAPAAGQEAPVAQPVAGAANLWRLEGTDAGSGIHYVRLTVLLAGENTDSSAPPHFTIECTELSGKRDLNWFVSFGGVSVNGFTPPFHPTPDQPVAPKFPSAKLQMDFEGYMKWKPMTRVWQVLPSGELEYRNPGMHSPNMDTPRAFLAYLNSLPALRIGFANPHASDPKERVFQTKPLLDELWKTPICRQ